MQTCILMRQLISLPREWLCNWISTMAEYCYVYLNYTMKGLAWYPQGFAIESHFNLHILIKAKIQKQCLAKQIIGCNRRPDANGIGNVTEKMENCLSQYSRHLQSGRHFSTSSYVILEEKLPHL